MGVRGGYNVGCGNLLDDVKKKKMGGGGEVGGGEGILVGAWGIVWVESIVVFR